MHHSTEDQVCHCHECREERHLQAWKMFEKGMNQCDIAEVLGVTEGAVSQWINRAKEEGPESLKCQPRSGADTKLSEAQQQRLVELLKQGAESFGFEGELWTTPRVTALIQREFGVTYENSSVYKLLDRLGFSYQKPAREARKRDEQQVQRWVHEDWPRIKKKPAAKTD